MDITDYRNLDGKLLAVKCLYENGCGHGGYDWSPDDHDIGDKWDNIASCQGTTGAGGFYAWPLGIGIGDGKEPNACHPWIVIEITGPCVMIDQKIKFKSCKVIYRGTMANCMYYTMADRIDFITRNSISMTGDRASSSMTGYSASSSMTGDSASSSMTGDRASSSMTGDRASSSMTGDSASSSMTGYSASSSMTGDSASSSMTGYSASSSMTGDSASSSMTGDRASSSMTGEYCISAMTGDSASSSMTGDRASSSMTGDRASSSITGEYCISAMTRASINSIIEVSPTSIAAIIGEEIRWRVRAGALLVQRWEGGHKTLVGKKQHDGKICIVKKGVIVEVNP
jgi:hypothetical protein